MSRYDRCEAKIVSVLKRLRSLQQDGSEARLLRDCLTQLMAQVANAMLAVAHPVLPNGGRDFTVLFSPSRAHMASVLKARERRSYCVHCKRRGKSEKSRRNQMKRDFHSDHLEGEVDDDDFDDVIETINQFPDEVVLVNGGKRGRAQNKAPETDRGYSDDELEEEIMSENEESVYEATGQESDDEELSYEDDQSDCKDVQDLDEEDDDFDTTDDETDDEYEHVGKQGRGEFVPIPPEKCRTAKMGIRHFACESCLDDLESCPMCTDLVSRLQNKLEEGCEEVINGSGDAMSESSQVFCPEIFGGFQASVKLQKVISSFEEIPKNEKALVVSFYKGSLDLLERMFTETYPAMQVARFDADIHVDEREKVLEHFKSSETCRVLLMTVKTGGVGLNMVEANHVLFVDRSCELQSLSFLCVLLPRNRGSHNGVFGLTGNPMVL